MCAVATAAAGLIHGLQLLLGSPATATAEDVVLTSDDDHISLTADPDKDNVASGFVTLTNNTADRR